jgi:hypothetical protein
MQRRMARKRIEEGQARRIPAGQAELVCDVLLHKLGYTDGQRIGARLAIPVLFICLFVCARVCCCAAEPNHVYILEMDTNHAEYAVLIKRVLLLSNTWFLRAMISEHPFIRMSRRSFSVRQGSEVAATKKRAL